MRVRGRSPRARLERLEAGRAPDLAAVWIHCGYPDAAEVHDSGGGVYHLGVADRPEAIPPGLLVILRHGARPEDAVRPELAAEVLELLAFTPRQRGLVARAACVVLVTDGPIVPSLVGSVRELSPYFS